MTDAKQDAVLRCLKAGYAVDEQNPYAGRHFYAALRCAKIDEARVRAREERRSVRHLNHEKLRERIDRGERSICDRADSTRVAEHNEFLRQVMSEVGRLPRGQRDAIMARCLNEVPEWRYAIEIGGTQSSVRALLYRGLQGIRNQLNGSAHGARRQLPRRATVVDAKPGRAKRPAQDEGFGQKVA